MSSAHTQVRIRPYQRSGLAAVTDAARTLQIFHSSVHEGGAAHYTASQRAAWAPETLDFQDWSSSRRLAHTVVAMAPAINPHLNRRQAVGFSDHTDDGVLDMLYVDPRYMGRGVGAALVAHILAAARERGHRRIDTQASLTAMPLFLRLGFTLDAQQTVQRRGERLDNYRMHIDLPRSENAAVGEA